MESSLGQSHKAIKCYLRQRSHNNNAEKTCEERFQLMCRKVSAWKNYSKFQPGKALSVAAAQQV
jgi:hypothetical protein